MGNDVATVMFDMLHRTFEKKRFALCYQTADSVSITKFLVIESQFDCSLQLYIDTYKFIHITLSPHIIIK